MNSNHKMALASTIIGCFAIITCCNFTWQLILGVAAISLAIMSANCRIKNMEPLAVAGIILGAAGILLSFLMLMLVLEFIDNPVFAEARRQYIQYLNQLSSMLPTS